MSPRDVASVVASMAAVVVLPEPPFGPTTTTWCEPGSRERRAVATAERNSSSSLRCHVKSLRRTTPVAPFSLEDTAPER